MNGWTYQLRSGSTILDISSGVRGAEGIYVEDANPDMPPGEEYMTLPLGLYTLGPGQIGAVNRLEEQITQFLRWARDYQRYRRTDRVELWAFPNIGAGAIPTYGDYVRIRHVTGGSLVPPYNKSTTIFAGDQIPGYRLNLTCGAEWEAPTFWVNCARGGILQKTGGLAIWQGTTNLCERPRKYNDWTAVNGATIANFAAPQARIYGQSKCGDSSFMVTVAAGQTYGGGLRAELTGAPLAQSTYTLSVYARGAGGSIGGTVRARIYETGGANPTESGYADGVLGADAPDLDTPTVTLTYAMQRADRTGLTIEIVARDVAENDIMIVDFVQLEEKAYHTPACYGERTVGHRWAGTYEQSTSTRDAAVLFGSAYGVVKAPAGAISLRVQDLDWDSGRAAYLFDCGENDAYNRLRLYKSAGNMLILSVLDRAGTEYTVSVDCSAYVDANEYVLQAAWATNDLRLLVNGASVGVPLAACEMPSRLGSAFYLGSDRSGANQCDATILSDLKIYDVALTDAQLLALYNAGRWPGHLPYVGSLAAGTVVDPPTIKLNNAEDNTPLQNWAQIGNVPGGVEALVHWFVAQDDATALGNAACYYYALKRGDTQGTQWLYSAHDRTLDGETVATADAACAFGYKARTTPTTTSWVTRISLGVDDMRGRWRVFIRAYDGSVVTGAYKVRASVRSSGGHYIYAPSADGVSPPVVGTWHLLEIGEVEIPPVLGGELPPGTHWTLDIDIKRDSGVGTFDTNYIWVVPKECSGRIGPIAATYYLKGAEMNGIADDPCVVGSINRISNSLYPDTYSTLPLEEWHGSYPTLTPGQVARFTLANLGYSTAYQHTLTAYRDMNLAMRIKPRYLLPW